MADLEKLTLTAEADTKGVTQSLNQLAKSLENLKVAATGLSNVSTGLANLSNALQSFGNINPTHLTQVANSMGAIGRMSARLKDLSNLKNLTNIAPSIASLGNAISTMNNIDYRQIDNVIRAIRRLNSVGAIPTDFTNIVNGVQQLATVLANANMTVEPSVTRFVSSLARLSSTGGTINAVANNLPQLSNALYSFVVRMSSAGKIESSVVALTNAIAQLSSAGANTSAAAAGLQGLGTSLISLFNQLNKAPKVRSDVARLVNSLGQLSNNSSRVNISMGGASNGLKRFSSAASNAHTKTKSLTSALSGLYAKFYILLRAFRGVKNMIEYASDLTEVQNVVNMTFAESSDKMEEFVKISSQAYGMNELTAKQIGSRYQAMGVAMGYATDEMADMSIELTKLAGDMASFYNVEQSAVAEDLESIFTGQTRPLRTYGLDLTQATLKEYALSKGMNANFQSMTQAEKAMLRYNYVMEHTANAQGDFARTINTWANQVRLLKQLFQQLGSTIGQTFINAFKPVVRALNSVLGAVNEFAVKVSNSLGAIFGWYIEIPAQGITQELEDAENYTSGLADNTGTAAKNAEKLKASLQGFDELNNLTTSSNSGSGGSGSGSGSGTSGGASGGAQIVAGEGLLKKYESELDTLYKLGDYIGSVIQDTLESINWDNVYTSAKDFGTGLADFLNGLISPQLFYDLGKTIANSINTAVITTSSFASTFDFKDLGLSIATAINSLFENFDFGGLGRSINKWALGIISTLSTAVSNVEWEMMGEAIKKLLEQIDFAQISVNFGAMARNLIQGISKAIESVDWEMVGDAIGQALANLDLGGIVSDLIKLAENIIKALGKAFLKLTTTAPLESGILGLIALCKFTGLPGLLGTAFSKALNGTSIQLGLVSITLASVIGWEVGTSVSKQLWAAIWGDEEEANEYFSMRASDVIQEIYDAYKEGLLGQSMMDMFSDLGFGSAFEKVKKESDEINSMWTDLFTFEFNKSGFEDVTNEITDLLNGVDSKVKLGGLGVKASTKAYGEQMSAGILGAIPGVTTSVGSLVSNLLNSTNTNTTNALNTNTFFNSAFSLYKQFISGLNGTDGEPKTVMQKLIEAFLGGASESNTGVSKAGKSLATSLGTSINNESNNQKDGVNKSGKNLGESYNSGVSSVNVSTTGKSMANNVASSITKASNDSQNSVNKSGSNLATSFGNAAMTGLKTVNDKIILYKATWNTTGTNLVEGLRNGITQLWNNTSNNGLVGRIVTLAKTVTNALKKAFGVASPSKVWRNEIGVFLPQGLTLGIEDGESDTIASVKDFANNVNTTLSDSLYAENPLDIWASDVSDISANLSGKYSTQINTGNLSKDIVSSITSSTNKQIEMLKQQNELLTGILNKKFGITDSEIYDSVRKSNRTNYINTGRNSFAF